MIHSLFSLFDSGNPLRMARRIVPFIQKQPALRAAETLCHLIDNDIQQLGDAAEKSEFFFALHTVAREIVERLLYEAGLMLDHSVRLMLLLRHALSIINRMRHLGSLTLQDRGARASTDELAAWISWQKQSLYLSRLVDGPQEAFHWKNVLDHLLEPPSANSQRLNLDAGKLTTAVRRQLGELLMTSMIIDADLDTRQFLIIQSLLPHLSEHADLDTAYHSDRAHVVTRMSSGRPHWIEGWELSDLDGQALFMGFSQIDQDRQAMEQTLRSSNDLPIAWRGLPDQSVTETLAILGMLGRLWAQPSTTRMAERLLAEGGIRIAFQLMMIRGLLAQPGRHKPNSDSLVRDSEIVDVSTLGFGLLLDQGSSMARAGSLVALYQDECQDWILGVVRRLHRETDGQYFAGVQVLSREAIAVRLHFDDHQAAIRERLHAVFLRSGTTCQHAGLLISEPVLEPGHVYYLLGLEQAETRVQVDRFIEAGNDYVLYDCQIISE